jgi:protocatechuate 3,4-dioxygenase beta subunit
MRAHIGAGILTVLLGTGVPLLAAPRQVTPPPPPACVPAGRSITPSQTEGPFYKPNAPLRRSLREPDTPGTPLIVTGYVLSRNCRPIPQARLDFWQADDRGAYDATGYRLRGQQRTDAGGVYYLETIMPGEYPGRTRHIHVKVQAPDSPILTTQVYFPGESGNQVDSIFNPQLVAALQETPSGKVALFNFVLDIQR